MENKMDKIYLRIKDTDYVILKIKSFEMHNRKNTSYEYTDISIDISIDILDESININNLIPKMENYLSLGRSYSDICIPNIFDNKLGNCLIGGKTDIIRFVTKINEDNKIHINIKIQANKYEISEKYPEWLLSEIRDNELNKILNDNE